MTKARRPSTKSEAPRVNGVRRAGELVGSVGGVAFKRFGFVQSAVVERWGEIVGERYARHSLPESIRFPAGAKSGGTLTLLVEGAHAPLIQHLAPMIMERVNTFFGYPAIAKVVFRQGRVPVKRAAPRAAPKRAAIPEELGEGLRAIPDGELRTLLESLAERIAASDGPPDPKPLPPFPNLRRIS